MGFFQTQVSRVTQGPDSILLLKLVKQLQTITTRSVIRPHPRLKSPRHAYALETHMAHSSDSTRVHC